MAVLAAVAALLVSCGGGAERSAESVAAVRPEAQPDEVLTWNEVLRRAMNTPIATPGALQGRVSAIVHVSMFEALNGIEPRRFESIHPIVAQAPSGASRRAAVVEAAYTALTALFPAQSFASDRAASLAAIGTDAQTENSGSIALGLAWGAQVANEILAWRAGDVIALPPYLGGTLPGEWQPTPPGFAPGLAPWMALMQPFVIASPSSFRPAGPPALGSGDYAADVNEVKDLGELNSARRTLDQTQIARFWAGTAVQLWNRAAGSASLQRRMSLSENARLFAVLNAGIADALIACWDAKYYFSFWRPITAIRRADEDGNPATDPQADWTPLLVTPPYPEYYSGHQSVSGTAQAILTAYFGSTPFDGTSEGFPGVTLSWSSFAAAADEAYEARIWGGIHFRFTMRDTRAVAEQIAAYVLAHAALPLEEE